MKVRVTIFFSILFLGLLVAPTVICLTNSEQDIAYFLDVNEEEEENNGKEEAKTDSKLKLYSSIYLNTLTTNTIEINENKRFHSKNYISKYPKITTPPPKFLL